MCVLQGFGGPGSVLVSLLLQPSFPLQTDLSSWSSGVGGGGVGCVCVHALTLQGVVKGMLLPGYCMSLSFVSVGGPSIDCCFCNLIHSLGQYFSVISSHFVASMKFASGVRYLGFDSNLMSLGGLPRYLLCLGWLHACWALCTFYSLESVKIVVQQGVSQNSIW